MTKREEQQLQLRGVLAKIQSTLAAALDTDFYFTTDFQTLSFSLGEIDGVERWASLKLTMHKPEWDIDEAIDEFEDRIFIEEKKREAAERKENKKGKSET